tara:strand:+ start:362 stop:547 length:186 start_codon:yes stop_codon:yes gene_type:complete
MRDITKQNTEREINNQLISESFEGYKKAANTIGLGIAVLTSFVLVIKLGSIILSDLKKSGL